MNTSTEQIELFKNIFKWREDVYAYRWENDGKSWYSPAYDIDWYKFTIHKAKGWNMSTFQEKTTKKLTDYTLQSHIGGKKIIGIYPLLKDNTSYFIVADFDKKDWTNECKEFIAVCNKYWLS